MITARRFQALAVLSTGLYGLFLLFQFLPIPISPVEGEALSYAFAGAPAFTYHPFVFVALFIVRATATFGLVAFFTWGRRLFFVWLAVSVLHGAISGIYVATAIESTLAYLLSLMDGAILAFAYSNQFESLWRIDGQAQQGAPADGPASRARG